MVFRNYAGAIVSFGDAAWLRSIFGIVLCVGSAKPSCLGMNVRIPWVWERTHPPERCFVSLLLLLNLLERTHIIWDSGWENDLTCFVSLPCLLVLGSYGWEVVRSVRSAMCTRSFVLPISAPAGLIFSVLSIIVDVLHDVEDVNQQRGTH